ncbi:MAG: RNA polymerase sigma factor [Lachnospiraceae bacterium]|nr:RNA polymerase sigma factor [Lachnospiraceae bacterium]
MKCDVDTFARMYEEIYKDLYRFALCLMKNEPDAEDAVSDAVLSGYENIRKLRKEEAFKSWMFTILANTCKKKLQSRSRKLRMEQDMESAEPERNDFGTWDADLGISVDVQRAFFHLSEEEQTIIALSVFGGYNSKEIGALLQMNANTVRSKRSRGLEKMECILE